MNRLIQKMPAVAGAAIAFLAFYGTAQSGSLGSSNGSGQQQQQQGPSASPSPSGSVSPSPSPSSSVSPSPSVSPSESPSASPSPSESASASPSPSASPSASPSESASPSPSNSGTATGVGVIATSTSQLGTFLVDGQGKSLYVFLGDSNGQSNCSGACAAAWPPYTVSAGQTPSASGSAQGSSVGTIQRSDGTTQVTYNGKPLYYYAGDSAAGQTNGQGLNQFGAFWYLEQPDGTDLTGSSAGASPSASPSGASTPAAGSSGSGY